MTRPNCSTRRHPTRPIAQEAPGNSNEARLLQLFQRRTTATRKGPADYPIRPFGQWARRAWPVKAPANLAYVTGCAERTCKSWLAGAHEPRYPHVVALLRSEEGESFLRHVIGDARPSWWIGFDRGCERGELREPLERLDEAAE